LIYLLPPVVKTDKTGMGFALTVLATTLLLVFSEIASDDMENAHA
jgi:hypothetical protein